MAMIELHCDGVFLSKVATATVGYEPGSNAAFLIAGPLPALDRDEPYALVIEGFQYPIRDLKLSADGKTINAKLI